MTTIFNLRRVKTDNIYYEDTHKNTETYVYTDLKITYISTLILMT